MFRALTIGALVVFASAAPAIILRPQGSYGVPNEIQTTHESIEDSRDGHRVVTYKKCDEGLARRADGECVEPIIKRNIYVYDAPKPVVTYIEPDYIPTPKVDYNYVFVRTANAIVDRNPIVIPPAQQKTLVYLLNKQLEKQEREVIEVDGTPDEPEVYFVNYKDGENKYLPGGIDLQTALSQTANSGKVIHGEEIQGSEQRQRSYWRYGNDDDEEEEEESSESDSYSSESDSDEEEEEDESEHEEGEEEHESEHETNSEHEEGEEEEHESEHETNIEQEGGEEENAAGVDLRSPIQHIEEEEAVQTIEESLVKEQVEPQKEVISVSPKKEEAAKPKRTGSSGFPPAYILN